jgi:ribosome-binding protein aMBF1 (putative translation factor)
MARPFEELEKKMSSAARAKAKRRAQELMAEMPIHELRRARELSQEHIADKLKTQQANISQIERRTDMYISTLRGYIEAMGGQLLIIAHFPEGDVSINQFNDIGSSKRKVA